MEKKMEEAFNRLLLRVADQRNTFREDWLTSFFARKGHKATGKLMVVGRSVNGWTKEGWAPEKPIDPEGRADILRQTFKVGEESGKCPMLWLTDLWGSSHGYNPKRAAFWRVIHSVTERLHISNASDWSSHLIWTNLYKVAPAAGGNPSNRLIQAQYDICVELLGLEIHEWLPRRILMLTGLDWALSFIGQLGIIPSHQPHNRYVDYVGVLALCECSYKIQVVVAKHPQGKSEEEFVGEVISGFTNQSR